VRTAAQLGSAVRRLRSDKSWSQRELAEAAHVSRVFVSQLENGKARAEMHLVLAVIQALGASVVVIRRDAEGDTDLFEDQPW